MLDQANVGETLRVSRIEDPEVATLALRLGISEGASLRLTSKVPGGPLVVTRGKVEIALGREICRGIEVERQEV